MSNFPRVILHNKKIDAVKRFHPWIFSGAIKKISPEIREGDVVDVYSDGGEYLATGHYSPSNIAIKILAFHPVDDLKSLFLQKFQSAYGLRQKLGFIDSESTTTYRLVNAEGDGLPGLIIDWYNGTAVLQAYSLGMYEQRSLIVDCLKTLYGSRLNAIYDKSATVFHPPDLKIENQYLLGDSSTGEIVEYGHRFLVDWEEGQKTGLFLDQRENRLRLSQYVTGKHVLNTFCYSGGFSAYAVKAGAASVQSVDSSARAIEWTIKNVEFNNPTQVPHEAITADVFDFLKHSDAAYDVIVLDPPAFAKNLSARHQAVMAYKRLNKQAFAKVRSGGLVVTFSCSQVVTAEHFKGAVTAAAIESGKQIRVLDYLNQPADHPVSIYHPEGLYLKGFVLLVE